MTKDQLVEKASGELTLGLDAAAQMIADWLKAHDEPLQPLCKSVADKAGIPEAGNALRTRVQRMRSKSSAGAKSGRTTSHWTEAPQHQRTAKAVLKNAEPEDIAEMLSDPAILENVEEAVLEARNPEFRQKAKAAKQREDQQRADNKNVRVVETFSLIGSMARAGRKILELLEEVGFETEDRDLLAEDYERRVAYIHNLIKSALEGDAEIDWDAEFTKITEALQ